MRKRVREGGKVRGSEEKEGQGRKIGSERKGDSVTERE